MTTPGTADVRAWARKQGLTVADRGRLPAELVNAYTTAHKSGSSSPATTTSSTPAPSTEAPARTRATAKPAPVKSTAPAVRPAPARTTAAKPARTRAAAAAPAPRDTPSGAAAEVVDTPAEQASAAETADDTRLRLLEERLTALTVRVAELEQPRPSKPARFRRKKG